MQSRKSKLILCPFCFIDKIDSPFCLQNCFSFGCPFCSNFAKQILSRPSYHTNTQTQATPTTCVLCQTVLSVILPCLSLRHTDCHFQQICTRIVVGYLLFNCLCLSVHQEKLIISLNIFMIYQYRIFSNKRATLNIAPQQYT